MEKIEIHPASETERDKAAHLLADSEPWVTLKINLEQCKRNCNDPEFQVYMAYSGPCPAGVLIIDPRGVAGSPYIKSIAVFPEFRDKGIGTLLLSYAEELFRRKAKYLFICVSSFNHRARNLYEKFGFSAIGELRDYIIEGASEILMYKRL